MKTVTLFGAICVAIFVVISIVPMNLIVASGTEGNTKLQVSSTASVAVTVPAFTAATTGPSVSAVYPANASMNITVNVNITARFSEAMNHSTINTTTFILKNGTTPVSGIVTYSGLTAAFNSASNLTLNTTYTATITVGAKNLSGIPLAANYTWNFTTAPTVALGPAPVNLGTAGDFVILAKTEISTTGATSITGDIGVSPAAATYITGFGLIMDASGTYSTSSLVTGKVYAANYAVPTPAKMTTAVSDMQIAYVDAAGRKLPNATELGTGNIGGMTITPGLYKWSTGVTIPTDVTLSGGANDVWIFQISQNLAISNGKKVILSGGAQAKNIFWQVGGGTGVTLGTTSVFNGIILATKGIVLNTGATLNGRALAQTAVTLQANDINTPGTVPELSQVLIPMVGIVFVVAIVSRVRNRRK